MGSALTMGCRFLRSGVCTVTAWPFLGQMGTLSPPGAAALVKAALAGRALESSPMGPDQHTSISDETSPLPPLV